MALNLRLNVLTSGLQFVGFILVLLSVIDFTIDLAGSSRWPLAPAASNSLLTGESGPPSVRARVR